MFRLLKDFLASKTTLLIKAVQDKGTQTLDSILDDYTTL